MELANPGQVQAAHKVPAIRRSDVGDQRVEVDVPPASFTRCSVLAPVRDKEACERPSPLAQVDPVDLVPGDVIRLEVHHRVEGAEGFTGGLAASGRTGLVLKVVEFSGG